MKTSKKSLVGAAKAIKLFFGENRTENNDLNVKFVDNYLPQTTNLFQILTKKFGLRIG